MSAYSDWKCGALSDDEYKFLSRREYGDIDERDEKIVFVEEADCDTCIHNHYLYTKADGTKVWECDTHECEYEENKE